MTPSEKPRFMELLSTLFGAHGKPLSESMINGYWKGLEKMPLTTFERCCDIAIDKLAFAERGVSKTPNVAELWDIKRGMMGRPPQAATMGEPQWMGDDWDTAANMSLLAYIASNWTKRDPIDYSPDTKDPKHPGPHTIAIAKILAKWKNTWATDMREDRAEGGKRDGKKIWFDAMTRADAEVVRYLSQIRVAA